jgi:hypothetical protein
MATEAESAAQGTDIDEEMYKWRHLIEIDQS